MKYSITIKIKFPSSLIKVFNKCWTNYCNKYNIKCQIEVVRRWYWFGSYIIITLEGEELALDNAERQLKMLVYYPFYS